MLALSAYAACILAAHVSYTCCDTTAQGVECLMLCRQANMHRGT